MKTVAQTLADQQAKLGFPWNSDKPLKMENTATEKAGLKECALSRPQRVERRVCMAEMLERERDSSFITIRMLNDKSTPEPMRNRKLTAFCIDELEPGAIIDVIVTNAGRQQTVIILGLTKKEYLERLKNEEL